MTYCLQLSCVVNEWDMIRKHIMAAEEPFISSHLMSIGSLLWNNFCNYD